MARLRVTAMIGRPVRPSIDEADPIQTIYDNMEELRKEDTPYSRAEKAARKEEMRAMGIEDSEDERRSHVFTPVFWG